MMISSPSSGITYALLSFPSQATGKLVEISLTAHGMFRLSRG
jgi:hypothetical protein